MKINELKKALKGIDVVQCTPFNKDGSVDLGGMRSNTQWLLEHTKGKDYVITPVGSTGEFYAMSEEEIKSVAKTVVDEVKGKNIVFVGAGRAGTIEAVKACQMAESIGADGVQVVLPYYHIPTEEGMYQHYKKIAESISIGVMVYNNPDVSGNWIKPHLMARLSKIPNIIAVKENTPFMAAFYEMQRAIDPMAIFCGTDALNYSFASVYRCSGMVSGIANFAPDLIYSEYVAAQKRDFDAVASISNSIFPLHMFVNKMCTKHGPDTGVHGSWPMALGVFKAAMDIVGLRGGEVRLPLLGLDKEDKDELKGILKAWKVV